MLSHWILSISYSNHENPIKIRCNKNPFKSNEFPSKSHGNHSYRPIRSRCSPVSPAHCVLRPGSGACCWDPPGPSPTQRFCTCDFHMYIIYIYIKIIYIYTSIWYISYIYIYIHPYVLIMDFLRKVYIYIYISAHPGLDRIWNFQRSLWK